MDCCRPTAPQTNSFFQSNKTNSQINQSNFFDWIDGSELICFVWWKRVCFCGAAVSASAVFASFHQNKKLNFLFFFHSATGRQTKSKTFGLWPGARSPSAFTIQSICPFGRADWNELLNCWMGRASHQSVHLPQIQIKLTHRFVFVYNSWLAAYTVIILFISFINSLQSLLNSIKRKFTFLCLNEEMRLKWIVCCRLFPLCGGRRDWLCVFGPTNSTSISLSSFFN